MALWSVYTKHKTNGCANEFGSYGSIRRCSMYVNMLYDQICMYNTKIILRLNRPVTFLCDCEYEFVQIGVKNYDAWNSDVKNCDVWNSDVKNYGTFFEALFKTVWLDLTLRGSVVIVSANRPEYRGFKSRQRVSFLHLTLNIAMLFSATCKELLLCVPLSEICKCKIIFKSIKKQVKNKNNRINNRNKCQKYIWLNVLTWQKNGHRNNFRTMYVEGIPAWYHILMENIAMLHVALN
jgi:hypothetical protein